MQVKHAFGGRYVLQHCWQTSGFVHVSVLLPAGGLHGLTAPVPRSTATRITSVVRMTTAASLTA
jgi:hypothetical protein